MPFIALLINEMQETYGFQICAPIDFYGKNTFVLLGIHEMVFTITLLCVKHFLWQLSLGRNHLGYIMLCITFPVTSWCNKQIPSLVGERDFFEKYS